MVQISTGAGGPVFTRRRHNYPYDGAPSYPLIAGGRVFVTARDGGDTLYALDAMTGETEWARPLAGYGRIAYDDGRVFIQDGSDSVIAVSADTGHTEWAKPLRYPGAARLVALDGVLYVAGADTPDKAVLALDEVDGSTRWASEYTAANIAVDGQYVYLSSGQTTVALTRRNGALAWMATKECGNFSSELTADGARVIAPLKEDCGAVLDAADGVEIDDAIASRVTPAVAGDIAVTVDGCAGSCVGARSLGSGEELWQMPDTYVRAPALIVNETVYVATTSGGLHARDLRTGAALWSGTVPGAEIGASAPGMASANGLLVVPAGRTITAYEAARPVRPGLDLEITDGPDGPTNARAATLTFGSTSPAPQVCRLDQDDWEPCSGAAEYTRLSDGPHTFEVQARDASDGSVVALAVRAWSVDTTAPTAQVLLGPEAVSHNHWADFYLHRQAHLACRLDGGAWTVCANPQRYQNPTEGQHRLDLLAEDPLGNRQATPTTYTWIADFSLPYSPPAAAKSATQPSSGAQLTSRGLARVVAEQTAAVLNRISRRALRTHPRLTLYGVTGGKTEVTVIARRRNATFVLARSKATFSRAGTRQARLRLTTAGRSALARRGRMKVSIRVRVASARGVAGIGKRSARI